jgi:hypothetical protein
MVALCEKIAASVRDRGLGLVKSLAPLEKGDLNGVLMVLEQCVGIPGGDVRDEVEQCVGIPGGDVRDEDEQCVGIPGGDVRDEVGVQEVGGSQSGDRACILAAREVNVGGCLLSSGGRLLGRNQVEVLCLTLKMLRDWREVKRECAGVVIVDQKFGATDQRECEPGGNDLCWVWELRSGVVY